jgi:biotin carboxylase
MSKSIFILGGSMLQMPTIQKAKDRGLFVYVLDFDPECVAKDVADKFLLVSTIDKEAVLAAAKEYKPDYIMTSTSDMPVRTVAWVYEQLGRKGGIAYEDSICATDKSMMRLRMKEKNVPIPDFHILESFEDFEKLVKDLPETLKPVFVLKPADNAASRGVKLVSTKELSDGGTNKLKDLWDFTHEHSRGGRVLAEEYMEGPEVSVESVTSHGVTHIITITDKKVTHVPYFVETGHTEPSRLSKDQQEDIKNVALAAIEAVGIVDGPSHTEIKVTSSGAKLVEIAARLGGDFITSRLVPLSSGVNLNECELDAVLGSEPAWERTITRGSAIRFIPAKEGKIAKILGVEEAKAMPGVEEVVLYKKEGDTVPPLHSSSDRVGHVIATGADADEAEKNCEEALSKIELVIE